MEHWSLPGFYPAVERSGIAAGVACVSRTRPANGGTLDAPHMHGLLCGSCSRKNPLRYALSREVLTPRFR